nr:response regulator [Phycisphaerae bacterium]NIW92447.1 response regulator [Phycisphaerae bacterium]
QRGENPILMDAVICDIRMPIIDGVEAIKYFQTQYPRVPLIVMTGNPDVGMATSFLQGGVLDYLVKPVDVEKLRTVVANAVESKDNSFV